MSSRAYDYILTLNNTNNFVISNTVLGLTSNTVAEIIDVTPNTLKVKLANTFQQFSIGESLISNSAILTSYNVFINHSSNITGSTNVFALPATYALIGLSDAINVYVDDIVVPRDSYVINSNNTIQFLPVERLQSVGSGLNTVFTDIRETIIFPTVENSSLLIQAVTGNTNSPSFISANFEGYVTSASAVISDIDDSPYIAEKNATQQTALVKLYSIYYPGEWYPPKPSGNPSGSGDGFPWPYNFPIHYAEVIGDTFYDPNYAVSFKGVSYKSVSIESDNISLSSTGKINEIGLTISNFDGSIANLVNNKNILGFNSDRSTVVAVNGEQVQNIDPRTVTSNIFFNPSVFEARGENAPWDYESTISEGDSWTSFRVDSRDLTGAVVEIKLTYAKFLDFWPEYSLVKSSTTNSAEMYSVAVYRIGDIVTTENTANTTSITDIKDNTIYFQDSNLDLLLDNSSKLLIVNPDADSSAFVKHVFVLSSLEELDEITAKFNLSNWLQYFKQSIPKRKFYSDSCPFKYKGELCKYPSNGLDTIISSNPSIQANGFFTINNVSTANISEDICAKTLTACKLRNNLVNFGGFPSAE
jgi:phage-related protein